MAAQSSAFPSSPAIRPSRVGQVAVRVHDVERATAFYRDVMGLQFLFHAPGLAFFQCGEVRFMLSKAEKPEFDHPGSFLYLVVDDIQTAHRAMLDRGVSFRDTPHVVHRASSYELWMVFFDDPDGNPYALMEERKT